MTLSSFLSSNQEKQIELFCGIWYLPLEVKFAVFNWGIPEI